MTLVPFFVLAVVLAAVPRTSFADPIGAEAGLRFVVSNVSAAPILLMGTTRVAVAETITIQSGSWSTDGFFRWERLPGIVGFPSLDILQGGFDGQDGLAVREFGDTYPVGSVFVGNAVADLGSSTSGTSVPVRVAIDARFFGGDFELPPSIPSRDEDGDFALIRPFTINGRITITREDSNTIVFQGNLAGRGRAALLSSVILDAGHPQFALSHISYIFESSTPVPEPGTLLLTGLGIVGSVASRRRARGSRFAGSSLSCLRASVSRLAEPESRHQLQQSLP